jgi:hypothetical protein
LIQGITSASFEGKYHLLLAMIHLQRSIYARPGRPLARLRDSPVRLRKSPAW